ncbi:efflux RND transporter periplasmic adaptor subunit [soil metagenome]
MSRRIPSGPRPRGARLGFTVLLVLAGAGAACTSGEPSGDADSRNGQVATPPTDPHAGHAMPPEDPQAAPQEGAGDELGAWEAEVQLDPARMEALGIRTVAAVRGELPMMLRVTGSVEWDESRLSTVTLRYGGYVERLHVSATGDRVRAGAPLLDIYSPDLVAAFEELVSADRLERRLAGVARPGDGPATSGLLEAARRRLASWEVPDALVEQVLLTGEVPLVHTVLAREGGVVTERLVQVGERVGPGSPLYRLAAPSPIWIEARVPENDICLVREGQVARIELQAFPGSHREGRVALVYPSLDPVTRTGRLRISMSNPDGSIREGMYATVTLEGRRDPAADGPALLLPRDAVIRAGRRDVVFVEEHPGHFVGREVTLAGASADQVRVVAGLREGERVVARGAFLLDAESRLMTGAGGVDHSAMGH